MKRIGIISDTHGTFDPPLRKFLADVDEIWCAGDIGSPVLAAEIAAFKPLRAVYGNIDDYTTRLQYPEFQFFRSEQVGVLMTHIGMQGGRYTPAMAERIRALRPQLFVCGHSHILKIFFDRRSGVLNINPGAAGAYGFHKVRTAVRLVVDGSEMRSLEVWELPRAK